MNFNISLFEIKMEIYFLGFTSILLPILLCSTTIMLSYDLNNFSDINLVLNRYMLALLMSCWNLFSVFTVSCCYDYVDEIYDIREKNRDMIVFNVIQNIFISLVILQGCVLGYVSPLYFQIRTEIWMGFGIILFIMISSLIHMILVRKKLYI